jgi:hypothetical protein
MAQPNLKLVAPSQSAATWPDLNDTSDLLAIVIEQSDTIAAQAVLIDRYQGVLNNAQAGSATAEGIGTSTGTSLAMTSVTGIIAVGDRVTGAGIPTGTAITAIAAGGGAGTYTTNQATTATAAPLAFTPQSAVATGTGTATGTSLAVSAVNGTIVAGAAISGSGVPAATTIVSQISGTAGGAGSYTTSQATTAAAAPLAFTAPPASPSWPAAQDVATLTAVQQNQTAVLRTQGSLIQHYQDLLNASGTPAA